MAVTITAVTDNGGAAKFGNDKTGVTVSYAVSGVGGQPPLEILYVWITLQNGTKLQLFVNRESGLVVVDSTNKKETGGVEYFRKEITGNTTGRPFMLESLLAGEGLAR